MTAHVPMARVPFAPLDNPRLQHLASAKNRQNGAILAQKSAQTGTTNNSMKMNGGATSSSSSSRSTSNKRAYEPCALDEFDSENVDPAMFDSPAKKTKGNAFDLKLLHQHKSFTFSLTSSSSSSSSSSSKPGSTTMPPPPPSTSASPRAALSTPLRRKVASPRAPSTAPAGRSPTKRKHFGGGVAAASRRISAPFTRVDPPSLGGRSHSASALPFSLDAALSGSLSGGSSPKMSTSATTTTAAAAPSPPSGGATIAESMPKTWFFEIYQDTPEEEAANLMEHSTLTLDLSSDDEAEEEKLKLYRGKENTPPEGYDSVTASSSRAPAAAPRTTTEVVRTKVLANEDDMDDGERSPLSDLETEGFFPEGLSRESFVVVDEEKDVVVAAGAAIATTAVEEKVVVVVVVAADLPVVDAQGDVTGDIIVWEDKEDVL
ncbi:hypothetical protein BST61_g5542 [Cercospora zeina]